MKIGGVTIINLKIFEQLLYCAYDLETLNFQKSTTTIHKKQNEQKIEQGCYILTNQGDIEIYTTEKIVFEKGKPIITLSSKFKSNISLVETHTIQELITMQLETEAFLGFDNYKDIDCSCELII